jgi:hypothetical protein
MRNDNYPSASEMVRNLNKIRSPFTVLKTDGKFRVIQFGHPYFDGQEFWVVNEKGFMWQSVENPAEGQAYLETEEAKEYNAA